MSAQGRTGLRALPRNPPSGTRVAAAASSPSAVRQRLVMGLMCLWAGAAASAGPPQTVYRCGPDGRVYSQTPCSDGRALTIDDSRSASQQQAAQEVASRDARQAQQLADERRQREAKAKGQAAAGLGAAPAASAGSAPARNAKGKSALADPNMSPPMRVPAQAAGTK